MQSYSSFCLLVGVGLLSLLPQSTTPLHSTGRRGRHQPPGVQSSPTSRSQVATPSLDSLQSANSPCSPESIQDSYIAVFMKWRIFLPRNLLMKLNPSTALVFTSALAAALCSNKERGITFTNSEMIIDAPHFELNEDPAFWKDHNVQVLLRIRPLNNIEKVLQGYGRCPRQESSQTVVWLGQPETRFTFDHIACETISQGELFRVAGLPMLENCMSGYNSCMFAFE